MTENTKNILKCLKSNQDRDLRAQDVAEEVHLPKQTVDLVFNNIVVKGWGKRIKAKLEFADGSKANVTLLRLTDAGKMINPDYE